MTPDTLRLAEIITKMEGLPVLVVGDIMLDRFVYGHVERISPESPVPVLSVKRENTMLGGAGNTLSNLVHLGIKAHILSVVGDDVQGREIADIATRMRIDVAGLIIAPERQTIIKTRYLAGHQQLLRTDYERIEPITESLELKLLDAVARMMPQMRAIIISDYGKGLLTPSLLRGVISKANALGLPILADPKGIDFSIYKGVQAITPNKKELSLASGLSDLSSDEKIVQAARAVINKSGVEAVVATRSAEGMSVITSDTETHIKSRGDIEVFDVSGAGDTVIATIAAALAAGSDLADAARLANIAGSIVVAKVGTAPIRAAELQSALSHDDGDTIKAPRIERMRQAPVLSWDEAKEDVLRWRARGLKIGLTNGCFDILHYGHVSYLNEARAKCDRLVVALNHDQSVRLLKGPTRPVHDEASRAAVIGALGAVDLVVMFGATQEGGDNTACDLIEMLQPDIYFKGGDYTVDQIPEAPSVLKYGGRVEVMPVYDGHSSTASIAKIRA